MLFLSWGVIFMIILKCYVLKKNQLLLGTDLTGYFWFYIYYGCFNSKQIYSTFLRQFCPETAHRRILKVIKAEMIALVFIHRANSAPTPETCTLCFGCPSSTFCFSHNPKLPWILLTLLTGGT